MLHTFHAPDPIHLHRTNIFLAGTIDMGNSHDWQQDFIDRIEPSCESKDVAIFNPRRKKRNSDWSQTIDNEPFNEQVNWELNALEQADYIVMFLEKNSKSPISLLELGLFADSGKLLVCCEEGFWRKGNVDIVCKRKGIKTFLGLEEILTYLIGIIA
jgi:hypothetical protein